MTSTKTNSLPSRSWQELYFMYKLYGAQLIELARIKRVFGFEMKQRGAKPQNFAFQFVEQSFKRNVDEVDGMLLLLDAEIKRRNALIGVIG